MLLIIYCIHFLLLTPSHLFIWIVLSHVFYLVGSGVAPSGLIYFLSSCPPPPQGIRVITRLPLSHHSMYHVISASSLV
jgi:hypothetical protein